MLHIKKNRHMFNYKKAIVTMVIIMLAHIGMAQTNKRIAGNPDTTKNHAPAVDKVKQEQLLAIMNSTRIQIMKLLSDTTMSMEQKRTLQRKLMQARTAKVDSILGYKRQNTHPMRTEGSSASQKQ
ncbi:hypothetical protein KXQ82_15450 [Mucilaginibacter sp. HMF5004]|uniref:hypothetical protein n=1 Tax=Mucilaginibacter rivuli TaxID=2857527 RepID=UPI001C5F39E0|nr:hypothetical protein [Mucilaginibacter rivuli]MBW4891120.1 hypothetical protein [Mucilaginibacter rivuli]